MHTTRPAAVAGSFYPGNREILAEHIGVMLNNAASTPHAAVKEPPPIPPHAINVPHAGYI